MKQKGLWLVVLAHLVLGARAQQQPVDRTNIIVILTDDQGYQDLGCYGSPDIRTPNIDAMAKKGIKFSNYYSASSVCTASRASFLTGRIPARHGMGGVIIPDSKGLNSRETTIAQQLKASGYATACYGKWHLGDTPDALPTARGFDEYFGIPYSNDMYIASGLKMSAQAKFLEGYDLQKAMNDQAFVAANKGNRKAIEVERGLKGKVPLMEGDEVVEYPCEQSTTTRRYFDRTINFISENKDRPFFIYLVPNMPHVPLYPSLQFKGKSRRGAYGDVVEEIDWNVGRLMSYLQEHHLDGNTLVIFSSDNGPWLAQKENAGSAKPLRDGKFSNFEGGVRVPAIMCWKGRIPANTISDQLVSSLDLFPTISKLAGGKLPADIVYDGMDISNFLFDPKKQIERDIHYYNTQTTVGGVLRGDWKYLPLGASWQIRPDAEPLLFNLKEDVSEKNNLYKSNPDKVKELDALIKEAGRIKKTREN